MCASEGGVADSIQAGSRWGSQYLPPQSKNLFQEEERTVGRRNERKEGRKLGLQTKELRDDDDCKMKTKNATMTTAGENDRSAR